MKNNTPTLPYDLGVVVSKNFVYLFTNLIGFGAKALHVSKSTSGLTFKAERNKGIPDIVVDGQSENTTRLKDFRISEINKKFYLVYKRLGEEKNLMIGALSKNLTQWEGVSEIENIHETGMLIPNYKKDGKYVMYYGEENINVAFTSDLKTFTDSHTVLSPRPNYFDRYPLEVGSVIPTDEGILVLYFVKEHFREGVHYSVGTALFDTNDPTRLLWRRDIPLYRQAENDHKQEMYPLGAVKFKNQLFLYFGLRGKSVVAIKFENFDEIFEGLPERSKPQLIKHTKNPILEPVLEHAWEHQGAFNPGAMVDEGKVHLVYRAMGNNTSYLGYAVSSDGLTIDERSREPIFSPSQPFDIPGKYPMIHYMSGGGYGGCEDPRITKIEEDQKIYLTYVAYNGVDAPRVALSSIEVEEFRKRNWDAWETPKLISPPGVVDKNCVVFPEKVNGKYVVMHRVFPNILVDFVDDLNFENGTYLKGEYIIEPKENSWDSRKVGAGAPPIKTDDGWLLIYHAVDDRNDSQYKMGAMLLDLKDPTKVLYRTNTPILAPTEHYENHGFKAGVAYPCGAVIKDDDLHVYYGGADMYTCVASRNVKEFIRELKEQHPVEPAQNYSMNSVLHHYV